jgi:hypothetical protein
MGNSTKSLQKVVDYCRTIGDLSPILAAGGYSAQLPLEIANDVMTELLAQRFNWKFNRIIVPPFYTISWQQDYATINQKNIGWLEHAVAVDINNTALPKPIYWLEVGRDIERTSYQFGRPSQICWLPNDQLVQDVWPGIGYTFTNPSGAISTPSNKIINILDANGNILILTTYGTTGAVAPLAAVGAVAGVTVNDNTCVWTVADPKAQGFRVSPLPPQTGVVYQIGVIAQAKPVQFTTLAQTAGSYPRRLCEIFSGWIHCIDAPALHRAHRAGARAADETGVAAIAGRGTRSGRP